MLSCHSCLRHCLPAVPLPAPLAPSNALARHARLRRPSLALSLRLRNHATQLTPDAFSPPDGTAAERKNREYYKGDAFRRDRETPYFQSRLRRSQSEVLLKGVRRDPGAEAVDPGDRRMLQKELAYLGEDPLQLADYVKKRLEKGDEQKALALVRHASKEMDCVVSWNHCIDHAMATGHMNHALKLYNEMKKRAQMPDAYTYTIVLRGLGNHAHLPQTVGSALSIYYSMNAPNSKLQPSTIHLNAVLRVCARASNMDALWGLAGKIPEKGPGAADSHTFTTILNAIRFDGLASAMDMTEDQIAMKRERAILEGRRIWGDIVGKWRAGDLVIDEALVCSMGRLLLIGMRPRDWDDVLSLIEQTMDIPRVVLPLGAGPRPQDPKLRLPHTPVAMKREDLASVDLTDEYRRGGEFDPVDLTRTVGKGRSKMAYVTPTGNTLSMILDSCMKMVSKKTAQDYWNLLTDPVGYNVEPDEDNLHMYLRILRQSRSSADAVEVIRNEFKLRGIQPQAKTFRIAMSTCVRDRNNPNAFTHASALLDIMANTLTDLDVRTIAMYVDVISELPRGQDTLDGLDRLGPLYANLKSMLNYGKDSSGMRVSSADRHDAIELFRRMIACFDRIMNRGEVPREQYAELTQRKSELAAYVTRTAGRELNRRNANARNRRLTPEAIARWEQTRRERSSQHRARQKWGGP